MLWSDVIEQERAVRVLRRAARQERVAHAYLFHGPEGVGKKAAALAFAQVLQCEHPDAGSACGQCASCTKVRRMVHPDVHVLFPYPKKTDEADVAERIQRMGEDPYAPVDYVRRPSLSDPGKASNRQVMYHIDRVHEELLRPMSLKPLEGRYKVALITDADLMNKSSANAFLKLLEEPPAQTVFLLTTSRPDRFLPTILSRCQRLRFDRLAPEAIAEALTSRAGVEPDRAAAVARMADGSYSRALELAHSGDLHGRRRLALDYLRHSYTQKVDPLADLIDEMAGQGRERVKGLLRLLLGWMRDLLLYRTMGEEASLVNVDQAEAVARFCRNLSDADLEAMAVLVEEALDLISRNVRVMLVLTVLAHALARAMRGQSDERLYVPLPEAALPAAPQETA